MKTYYFTLQYFTDQFLEPVVITYGCLFIIYVQSFVNKIEIVMGKETALFWYKKVDYGSWICYKILSHLIRFMLKITSFLRAIPLKKISGDIQKNTENKTDMKWNKMIF